MNLQFSQNALIKTLRKDIKTKQHYVTMPARVTNETHTHTNTSSAINYNNNQI